MKYFLDTEFNEYKKRPLFGKPIDTIELISIGIVSEDDREYYAICKEFDLKAAWDNEWLRENVLISVHKDLCSRVGTYGKTYHWKLFEDFTYKSMKNLLKWYGKTRKQIAEEIVLYTQGYDFSDQWSGGRKRYLGKISDPEFYAYYADYDWVVFCWLFGRMIDLPGGFPMYCRDLKQIYDEKNVGITTPKGVNIDLRNLPAYPKQTNKHNALDDAIWNKELYEFLKGM